MGTALRRPWLAWPAALASHYLLDRLPHLDPHAIVGLPDGRLTRREVAWGAVDGLVAIGLGVWLSSLMPQPWVAAGAAFAAMLPDILCFPWLDWRRAWSPLVKLHDLHDRGHGPDAAANWLAGLGTQVATVIAAGWVIMAAAH